MSDIKIYAREFNTAFQSTKSPIFTGIVSVVLQWKTRKQKTAGLFSSPCFFSTQSLIKEQRTAHFCGEWHYPSMSSVEAICKLGSLFLVDNLELIFKIHIPFGPELHIKVSTLENIVSLWHCMQWQKFINILIVHQEGKV